MLFYFACEAAGASCARHSLRPFQFEGETFDVRTRAPAARSRRCVSFTRDVILHTATASPIFIPPPFVGRVAGRRPVGWGPVGRAHPHIAPHPGLRFALADPPH